MRRLILVLAALSLIFCSFAPVEGRIVGKVVEGQIMDEASDVKLIDFIYGDANHDGVIDIADAVYILNYLFVWGPEPIPFLSGDCNCDQMVDIADAVYLVNYLFVNGPVPGCPTGWIDGVVYNSDTDEPLEGAIIKITALLDSVFSDTAGQFFFEVPSGQEFILTITKPGFTYAQRKATAPEERDVAVDPVYLKPLDTLVTHITPAGGTAVDSRGHIELIFPPGAVPYDIDVIATEYDKSKELPTPLPELSVFTYAVELEPHGVVFNDSVTMRIANTLGFEPGTPIPIGFFNDSTAQWEDVGMGYVSSDGEWSEYKIKRFSGYDCNLAIWWLLPDVPPQIKYDVTSPQNREIDLECGHSAIGRKTGTLWINHTLPQFRTMGVSQAPRFVYNSSTTHPNPIIETYTTVDSATMNRPYSVQWRLKIEGHENSTHFVGGYGNSQQAILISAKNFRGDTLETGSYSYTLEIANCYNGRRYSRTPCFGCTPTTQTNVTIPFPVCLWTSITGGQVVLNNRLKSPFGVGWGLAELQKLHFNPDGSITLEEGDGTLLTYTLDSLGNYLPPEGEYSQLKQNEDGSFTRRFRDGTKINFDDRGLMTGVVDRNQNTTSYNYNEDELLISIVTPVGQITQFVYDDSNYLDKVIDPAGRVTDFSIDSEGNVVEIMDPDSSVTYYDYSDHLLTRLINPRGDTTKYSYNEFYRLTEVEESGGACCKSGYYHLTPTDVQGLINSIPDTLGGEDNPAPRVNPDTIWSTSIDGKGNVTKIKTDKFGGILQRLDPLGHLTVFERDSNSNITEIIKPNGAVTSMTYDSLGNLLTYVSPIRSDTTRYTYDPNFNQVTSITDPKGNTTYIEYDGSGNAIRIIDALNDTTRMEYNARGQLTKIINALGDSSVFRYDSLGNLQVAINPLGDSVVLAYNLAGDVISSTDALGRVTHYEYDIMGRLIKEIDADSNITQYEYDENGNLTKVIDANLHETQFFYDRRDQLVKTINPLGDSTIYEYDINGNLILSINPNGDSIHYEYDPLDRLIKKLLPGDSAFYVYDLVGNIAQIEDSDSKLSFLYDLADRMIVAGSENVNVIDTTTFLYNLRYDYDLNGNVEAFQSFDPQGSVNTGMFYYLKQFSVGDKPLYVCSADLDGDGDYDLAVANKESHNITILKNTGDGTFVSAGEYSVGRLPFCVISGDFDADGDSDLAVANNASNNVFILKNNGDGTFGSPDSCDVGSGPISIFPANLDRDNDIDLAVANFFTNNVSILKNDGEGNFILDGNYEAGIHPRCVYGADFDGDDDIDLAVANFDGGDISVLINNGDGSFQLDSNYVIGGDPFSVFACDFDDDLDFDLVTSNVTGRGLSILRNDGAGNFDLDTTYYVGGDANFIVGCDVDGDNDLDLAVAQSGAVSILRNDGTGTFGDPSDYYAGWGPYCLTPCDLDGDGDADLAVTDEPQGKVSILKNHVSFLPERRFSANDPFAVISGDVDRDGDLDLITADDYGETISLYENDGEGTFQNVASYPAGNEPYRLCGKDLNLDGYLDITVANLYGGITVLKNCEGDSFATVFSLNLPGAFDVTSADLNGDGNYDLAVTSATSPQVYVLRGLGDGTFLTLGSFSAGAYPRGVITADLDKDGDLDLATANWESHSISILRNNGDGTFQPPEDYPTGDFTWHICGGDFDLDDDIDLAVTNYYNHNVSIFLNDGSGIFTPSATYQLRFNAKPLFISAFDCDLDGDLDLVTSNYSSGTVTLLGNNGDGSFEILGDYSAGTGDDDHRTIAIGDFDGDYDLDLATSNHHMGNSISILDNISGSFSDSTRFAYDNLNRLTQIVTYTADSTLFTYDKLSRRTSKQYANGVVAEYGYDGASQLLSLINRLNNDTISFYNYEYDPVGNRIKMIEEAGVDSFTYDVLYRLIGAIHPQPSNPEENFDYDGVGNRTFSHISTNYTYDAANRLLEDDQYEYRYDKNGNLVWKKEKATNDSVLYSWNAENTLLGFVEYHLGDTSKVVSYKYDGLGRRIEKKVDSLITKYVYDNEDIIFEFDGNDSLIASYTHGPGIDEPISVQRDSAKYYYHQDGLGSITCITDTLGNVINTYLYDSFGNIMERTGGLDNPYTYTGREWDEESGLYHFRARYYNPSTSQFIAEDPIGFLGGRNFYSYCENNPIIFLDPFGAKKLNWGCFGACSADNVVQTAAGFIPGVSLVTNYVEFQGYQKAFGYEEEFVKVTDLDMIIGNTLAELGDNVADLAYQNTLNAARNNAVTTVINGIKEVHRRRPPREFGMIRTLRRATRAIKVIGTIASIVDFGLGMIDCYNKCPECP